MTVCYSWLREEHIINRRTGNMDSLNVVVATPAFDKSLPHADNEDIRRIAEVSPKIKVKDASAMMMAGFRGDNSGKREAG